MLILIIINIFWLSSMFSILEKKIAETHPHTNLHSFGHPYSSSYHINDLPYYWHKLKYDCNNYLTGFHLNASLLPDYLEYNNKAASHFASAEITQL